MSKIEQELNPEELEIIENVFVETQTQEFKADEPSELKRPESAIKELTLELEQEKAQRIKLEQELEHLKKLSIQITEHK